MPLIRWVWIEGNASHQFDWEVGDEETLYMHLHTSYVKGNLDKEEHIYFLQHYKTDLHTPLSELELEQYDGNVITLNFPSQNSENTFSNEVENQDEGEEIQHAETRLLDDPSAPESIPWMIEETVQEQSEKQILAETQESQNYDSQKSEKEPKTFFGSKKFDNPKLIHRYKYTYRQEFYCTDKNKQWVAIIGGDDELHQHNNNSSDDSETESVNLCFLIDTSGSMNKWINGVRNQCQEIARSIQYATNKEPTIMLAGYGIGDPKPKEKLWMSEMATVINGDFENRVYNIVHWPFLSIDQFQPLVDDFKLGTAGGRGCYFAGEDTFWVMNYVCALFSKNGKNIIIHISDEYDKTGENVDLEKICALFTQREDITLFTLGRSCEGHIKPTRTSGGKFWDIKDAKDVDVDDILENVQAEIQSMLQFDSTNISTGIYYTQYDSAPFSGPSPAMNSIRTTEQSRGHGLFDGIKNMKCHYCERKKYAKCGSCEAHMCLAPNQTELQCSACGLVMPIKITSVVPSKGESTSANKKGK